MSKSINTNNSKSNKSKTSKDEFKFDSRQTKFIGKRTGKVFQSIDPSKSKNGFVTTDFDQSSSQDQQVQKNNSQTQIITISKSKNIRSSVQQLQNDKKQLKYQQTSQTLDPVKNKQKQDKLNEPPQIKKTQKFQEDEQGQKKQQYYNQFQQNSQKQPSYKSQEKQKYQTNKDKHLQDQFVFQLNQDSFKRNRQDNDLNQRNIQILQEDKNKISELNTLLNENLISRNKQQANIVPKIQKNMFQKQKDSSKRIKKNIAFNPTKKTYNKQLQSKKKNKQKKLSQILGIQNENLIFGEAIISNTQKKLSGSIVFLPNTKVHFYGFTDNFSQGIIRLPKDKQSYNLRQQRKTIFLDYLGSRTSFEIPIPFMIQSQIPFTIENESNQKFKVIFALTKDNDLDQHILLSTQKQKALNTKKY